MSLTRKVAFNTIFQIGSKILVTGLSLITIGYLTRYLGVSGYGDYTTIFAYIAFWAVIADFGFFWVLVRELSKPGADKSYVFGNLISVKFVFGLVIFTLAALVAFLIPQYSPSLKIGIAVIAASSFWMSLNNTYVGLFQSQLEMYKAALSEVFGRTLVLIGVLWMVHAGASLQAILGVYVAGSLLNFLLSFFWGSKYIKLRPRFDFGFWKMILIESFPLALLSIIGLIHFKIDTVILSIMKGPTDVGIYGVPYKILEIVLLIPGIFVGNVFPILTKYFHSGDSRLNESIQKTFDFLIILAVPVAVVLAVLAWPIIDFIAGKEYLTASTVNFRGLTISAPRVLFILAFSTGISFLLSIFSQILTVINKQKTQVWPLIVITAGNVALNIILIPRFSYFASAIINLLTVGIMLVWWFVLSRKYLHFKLNYGVIPKAALAGLVMGILMYFLMKFNVVIVAILGGLVYFTAGYLLKMFDWVMIKKLLPSKLTGESDV